MNRIQRILLMVLAMALTASVTVTARKPKKPRVEFQTTMGTFVITLFNLHNLFLSSF